MTHIIKILSKLFNKKTHRKLPSVDAYKLWSELYDDQPDNVVLYLEEKLFSEMLSKVDISSKAILDIGCGTGRHWQEILSKGPLRLTGFDNSREMTEKLKAKFADAEIIISDDNQLKGIQDNSYDVIISTLTIGHIREIEDYLWEWNRVLKSGAEILITDFHPEAFSIGMKRSFVYNNEVIEVENYFYGKEYLRKVFDSMNWKTVSVDEKLINEDVRHLFVRNNYVDAFNRYYEKPLILGIHLIKN